jgi:CheY-like chemotaxis protein
MTSSAEQSEIFYIDDMEDEIIITDLQLKRRNLDLDVQYFLDGADALSTLNERLVSGQALPPLVVTDLNMPGLDGPSFVQAVKSDKRFDDITVGICTASENPADATAALKSKADFVVVKPFDRDCLMRICEKTHQFSLVAGEDGKDRLQRIAAAP